MGLVTRFEIIRVFPCLADSMKIRFTAELDSDIEMVLPYLNGAIRAAIYNPQGKALTMRKDGMFFTFRGRSITGTKLRDIEHALQEIRAWIELINDVWDRRQTITPSHECRAQLSASRIYKALPATNCKNCGYMTCIAFATKVLLEQASVMACKPLFTPEWRAKRIALLELLEEAGYPVPMEFLR